MSREQNLPDRIADELIARIFTGDYAPGDRLPAERTLCEQLGVDRTSLRMALRQLSRMNLIEARRGSGITVLDYRTHAGIDFLAAVLDVPGLHLGGRFLLEALSHWERAVPSFSIAALQRATPAQRDALRASYDAQLAALDAGEDLAHVAAIVVDMQDRIIEWLSDVTLRLLANSTRALRAELTRIHLSLNDAREQIEHERALFEMAFAVQAPIDQLRAAHAAYLEQQHVALRAHLSRLPPQPHRTTRWEPPNKSIPRTRKS